ncbi:lytic transglycosylase domain-containing protein [Bisgaard Taxon 10/6]|uniref:lytic transglycosylase domain-containing protein n=1 Tax=Exercitatus varius TaxID=67857 RepID=UPI00294B1F30|nr:lytic transglycosylase domain-containing protein [Exercitatus varius]MDG2957042.1 lytic transglycosylase domain-containing protein [Exercitatus varius]MDG2965270.1 lytic transglycosylase domain-containing protein [Exercitatus varius]
MSTLSAKMLFSLFAQCAADIAPETLNTVIEVESSHNPYAIAVVYDRNIKEEYKFKFKQPQSEEEAQNIIKQLENHPTKHKSYSVGLMQVNSKNFAAYGVDKTNMFNACKNIEAGAGIFKDCYATAQQNNPNKPEQELLRLAASCYYSGNEIRGFKKESNGSSYVDRINKSATKTYKVPAIKPLTESDVSGSSSNEVAIQQQTSIQAPQPLPQPKPWDVFGDFRK